MTRNGLTCHLNLSDVHASGLVDSLVGTYLLGHHVLNQFLPPTRNTQHILRDGVHSYMLPSCAFQVYKDSFINRCLFGYIVS